MTSADTAGALHGRRLPVVDIARGAALVAMFGYHLVWDLAHFGYIDEQAPFSPAMRLASHVIACSFLFIAGASLVLARRTPFDWRAYGVRLGKIAAAALAVSLASRLLFPEALILFGILHCIAAASVLALPFLFLPWPAALVGAAVATALPLFAASHAFDGPWLDWTGLNLVEPSSNDFRPLLPWAAALLTGVGVMAFGRPRGAVDVLARIRGTSPPARLLAFGGRHSLLIYLVHQPIFFAALSAAVWAFGPPREGNAAPFLASCENQCIASNGAPSACVRACGCTAREMKSLNLWDKLAQNRLDAPERTILAKVAKACTARP
jgi:uncharacterized membrane protein